MSTIYCIQMGTEGPVKIGFTTGEPIKRLKALQTGNPYPLRLVGHFKSHIDGEKLFHQAFSDQRLEGEWFRFSDELLASFMAVAQFGGGLTTRPPRTDAGRQLLHEAAEHGVRPIYPDDTRHNEKDWDEVAEWLDLTFAEIDRERSSHD